MGYPLLKEKPHIGANFLPPPKSARERAVERWFLKKKPPLSTTTTSDKTVPGQYFDQETNLHYNRYRYYSSGLGRYITSDPVGIFGGKNSYLYSRANPIREFDINGLRCETVFGMPTQLKYGSDTVWQDWGNWRLVNTINMGGEKGGAFWLVTRCDCKRSRKGVETNTVDVLWRYLEVCVGDCGAVYTNEYEEWKNLSTTSKDVVDLESDILQE